MTPVRTRLLAVMLLSMATATLAVPAAAAVRCRLEACAGVCACPLHEKPALPSASPRCCCEELSGAIATVVHTGTPPSAQSSTSVAAPVAHAVPPTELGAAATATPSRASTGPDPPLYLLNLSFRR